MLETTQLMIPMRDGVRLAATRYRQADAPASPVVLMRIPYGREHFSDGYLYADYERLTEQGLCVVIEDIRGTGGSEGALFAQGGQEPQDGYDTIEWLAAQPWCNGQVGTFGLSFMGFAQMAAGATNPPHLVCMCPFQNASLTPFSVTSAMTLDVYHLMWLYGRVEADIDRLNLTPERRQKLLDTLAYNKSHWAELTGVLPLKDTRAAQVEDAPVLKQFTEFVSEFESPAYWQKIGRPVPMERITVPMLMLSGWFDGAKDGTLENYAYIKQHGAPEARKAVKLILGPWTHGGVLPRQVDGYDFGDHASGEAAQVNAMAEGWLLCQFAGKESDLPNVQYFMLGENAWHTAETWPPENAALTPFYLHADGSMNETAPENEPARTYVYDPADPSPSRFTDKQGRTMLADPAVLDERSDHLTYRTAALEKPLRIAGNVSVRLHAATTAVDTDFYCRLSRVARDGVAMPLTDGIVRARFRNGRTAPTLLTPNEPYEFTISLGGIAVQLTEGESLRLDVQSACYPKHDRSLGTGEKTGHGAHFVTAAQTIFHQQGRAACLELPILPG